MGGADSKTMPPGPPPCADDQHLTAQIGKPPSVEFIPDLETKVKMANNYVEKEFQAMIALRYKMKAEFTQLMHDYQMARSPIENDCNQVREALQKIAQETQSCEDTQYTNLGNMFEKRAKVGGNIEGCVDYKNDKALQEKSDCSCAAGSEEDGCKDAKIETDHTLGCTHLRKRILPNMNLWTLTSPGGSCYVGKDTWFNQGMLIKGAPADFKMPNEDAMPWPLLLFAPPLNLQRQRNDTDGTHPAKRARASRHATSPDKQQPRATAVERARAFL